MGWGPTPPSTAGGDARYAATDHQLTTTHHQTRANLSSRGQQQTPAHARDSVRNRSLAWGCVRWLFCLHTAEVTGSIPVAPTTGNPCHRGDSPSSVGAFAGCDAFRPSSRSTPVHAKSPRGRRTLVAGLWTRYLTMPLSSPMVPLLVRVARRRPQSFESHIGADLEVHLEARSRICADMGG